MNGSNNFKKYGLVLLALSSLTFVNVGTALAQQAPIQDPIAAPLAPSDPRAQVDPALRNAQPIDAPHYKDAANAQSAPKAIREIRVDLMTKRVEFGPVQSNRAGLNSFSNQTLPGRSGSVGGMDFEKIKSSGIGAQYVWGADNRIKVTNVTAFPWSAQCKLWMHFPRAGWKIGSATMIGRKYALTAGHCVFNDATSEWADAIWVYAGYLRGWAPFGSSYAVNMRTTTGWTRDKSRNSDFALLTLNRDLGYSTGWFGLANYSFWSYPIPGHLAAYSGDVEGGEVMTYDYGTVRWIVFTSIVAHWIDMNGGASGGGIYRRVGSGRYVFAVNVSHNSAANYGSRIDSDKFSRLLRWMGTGY